MRQIALFISLLLAVPTCWAQDYQVRVVSPLLQWNAKSLENFDPGWLHVKFAEGSDVELSVNGKTGSRLFVDGSGGDLDAVNQTLADALTIRRTFAGDRDRFRALKAVGEAASGQVGPDLSLWFDVELGPDRNHLAETLNDLNAIGIVEIAHPAPVCEPAVIRSHPAAPPAGGLNKGASSGGTPDFTAMQTYLYQTPVGLDAPSAWAKSGGTGVGTKFIDVELGWSHAHEDFTAANQFYQGQNNSTTDSYINHGNAVVGEVVGADNGYGITGFAKDAQWGTVGILIQDWPIVPAAFLEAAQACDPGDVWLIELQLYPSGMNATPMEYVQVNYDVIWTSSWSMDVICVEAGANGSQDLDNPVWNGIFDRNVRDSGAIMVGAGTPTGRVAEWFTNYGSRMDAHAWGSQITTTGYGDLWNQGTNETEYTATFGGTSGASPMVVGSCLCLQGISRVHAGGPMKPPVIRALLNATGINHLDPSKEIGPRPDLSAACDALLDTVAVPTHLTITLGTQTSGTLADVATSNDQYLKILRGNAFSVFSPSIWLEFDGTLPSDNPNSLSVVIESSVNTPGVIQRIEMFNFDTGAYENVSSQNATTVDSTVVVELTGDLSRFAENGTGSVRTKVTYGDDGTVIAQAWTACIDQMVWTSD